MVEPESTEASVAVALRGKHSDRSVIGAQVNCESASGTQTRCVTDSVGYASSSDLTVHFGLGEDRKASVEIRWPSGVVQKLGELAADLRLEVEEPAGGSEGERPREKPFGGGK